LDLASHLESFETITENAFILGGSGLMLDSPDIAKCLDALCADSNLHLLKLAGAWNSIGIEPDWIAPPFNVPRHNLSAFFSLVNPLFGQ